MADKTKSILEEAILDAEKIQEALKANTKEILRSVSKEEIDEIVRESLELEEAAYIEEDIDSEDDSEEEAPAMDTDSEEEVASDDEFEDETGEEGSEDYEETESDIEVPANR